MNVFSRYHYIGLYYYFLSSKKIKIKSRKNQNFLQMRSDDAVLIGEILEFLFQIIVLFHETTTNNTTPTPPLTKKHHQTMFFVVLLIIVFH